MHLMQDLIDKAQKVNETEPEKKPRGVNPPSKFYNYQEGVYSIRELAEMAGMSADTMRARLAAGWSVEDAMDKPLKKNQSVSIY